MVSAPGRRSQVAHACKRWSMSRRRACALVGVARSASRYVSQRAVADAPILARMRDLGAHYPRYGYRMIQLLLTKQGHKTSADRAYRLWRAGGLQVPRKRPRKRVATSRPRPQAPSGGNRLRLRHLRRWSKAQVPYGHRRMDPRVSCHSCGIWHPSSTGD